MPEEILSEHPERLRAVLVSACNPLRAYPDTQAYEKAFGALDLLVDQQSQEQGQGSLDRDDENEGDPGQVAQPHKHKKADGGPAELPVANPAQLQRGGKIIRCKEDAPDNQARI